MAESYIDRVKAGEATIRDVLEQGGLKPNNVGWKRVIEAGYDLDAPASSFNDVEDNQTKLKKLGDLATEGDFKKYLAGQNALNKQASNLNAIPALNVFGAGEVARNIGIETAKQARKTAVLEGVPEAKVTLPKIVQAISEIEDPNVRAAVAFNSLVPLRPVEVAKLQIGDINYETGTFSYTDDRGTKVRAKLDLPELALGILKEQEAKAKAEGRTHLFFDERKRGGNPANFRASMTTAINREGGLRDLMKPFESIMGREIKGSSDLRKLIPSIIVNELGFAKEASAIMGHTSMEAIAGEMSAITAKHYVSGIITEEGSGAKVALRALQNAYGEVLGFKYVNDLVGAMRLDVPDLTTVGDGKKIRVVKKGDTISVRNTVEGVVDEEVKASAEKQREVADREADKRIAQASQEATEAKIAEAKRLADPEVQRTLIEGEKAKIKTERQMAELRKQAEAEVDVEISKGPTSTKQDMSGLVKFLKGMKNLAVPLTTTAVGVGASVASRVSEAQEKIEAGRPVVPSVLEEAGQFVLEEGPVGMIEGGLELGTQAVGAALEPAAEEYERQAEEAGVQDNVEAQMSRAFGIPQ